MLSRFITPILTRLPILIAVAFSLYSLVLLGYTVFSWQQMKVDANTYLLADSRRQAAAVTDQTRLMLSKALNYAASTEIKTYLMNRDLGMSMRYGLGASLQAIDDRFRQQVQLYKTGVTERIIYLTDKTPLVDTMQGHPLPIIPPVTAATPGQRIDAVDNTVVTAVRVDYKGMSGGTLVTVSSVQLLYANLLRDKASRIREVLVTSDGMELRSNDFPPLPADLLSEIYRAPASRVMPWNQHHQAEAVRAGVQGMLRVKVPVSGTSMSLVTLLPVERAYGHIAPVGFIVIVALLPLLLLWGASRLDSMRLVAAQLQSEITVSQLQRQATEQRNRELADEIHHREAVELALTVSEERFRILFADSPEAYFIIADGAFIDCNRSAEVMFCATREQIIGQPPVAFAPAFQPDGHPSVDVARPISEESLTDIAIFEWTVQRLDGTMLVAEIVVSPMLLDGRSVRFTSWRDITARKQTEQEREKLQTQLIQAHKMESVGRLAGGVAHDFNNMLGVIIGYTDLSLQQLHATSPLYNELTEIKRAAERSAALTRQLLAFARKQTISPVVLNLNDAITNMLKILRRLIGEDIDLDWQPGANLDAVNIDPTQVDQILANLCANARDAIVSAGKVTIETQNITVDEAYADASTEIVPGSYVLLAVSDNGRGMDQTTREHLFEPFFTTKGLHEGTGLGLATVYGIVKQNHGFINVDSESGQGTSIKIFLPRHHACAEPMTQETPVTAMERGAETILLVEDEPAILTVVTCALEQQGYQILAVHSPSEALQLVVEFTGKIHLLVTDVVMPGMHGRELAQRLLTHYPQLKCLYMSGYTVNVIAHHGVLDTGVNFLQKPFTIQDLRMKVHEVLQQEETIHSI